jgi:hypothetical protein
MMQEEQVTFPRHKCVINPLEGRMLPLIAPCEQTTVDVNFFEACIVEEAMNFFH